MNSDIVLKPQNNTMLCILPSFLDTTNIPQLQQLLQSYNMNTLQEWMWNCEKIEYLNTNFIWFMKRFAQQHKNITFSLINCQEQYQLMYDALEIHTDIPTIIKNNSNHSILYEKYTLFKMCISYFSQLFLYKYSLNNSQKSLMWRNFFSNINEIGFKGLPVFGVMMFFLGIVMTLQGAYQLSMFSAELYVIDFLAISVFRELGPLLTGILLASRSISSITAQIGTMKNNEEIQMLEIMGLSPMKLIFFPKVLALVVISPFLTFYSCAMAMMGGLTVFVFYMKYSPSLFFLFLQNSLSAISIFMFAWKGPLFALFLGLIACTHGMRTKANALDLGKQTTSAVVASLLTILIIDGILSMLTTIM